MGNAQSLGYTKIADITENGTYLIFDGPSFLSDYPEQLSKDGLDYCVLRVTNGGSYTTYDIIAANSSSTEFGFAFGFLNVNVIAWTRVADTTPPQEYSLPLAEGITEIQPCTYHKNQFNEVTIHFNGQGTITEAMLLGTLPEGFRPAKIYDIPAVYRTADGYHAGGIVLWTDGTITAHVSIPSAIGCIFSASFIATS